jgi:hypothetical protein
MNVDNSFSTWEIEWVRRWRRLHAERRRCTTEIDEMRHELWSGPLSETQKSRLFNAILDFKEHD